MSHLGQGSTDRNVRGSLIFVVNCVFDIRILKNLQIVVTEIVEGDVGSSKLIVVVIFVKLIFGYSSSPIRRRPFFKVRKGPKNYYRNFQCG